MRLSILLALMAAGLEDSVSAPGVALLGIWDSEPAVPVLGVWDSDPVWALAAKASIARFQLSSGVMGVPDVAIVAISIALKE
jgi:hypothetical protein